MYCAPTFHFSEVPDKTEFISWSLPGESERRNVTCAVSGAFPRPRVRIKRSTAWGGMSVAHDVWSPDITDYILSTVRTSASGAGVSLPSTRGSSTRFLI